MALSKIFGKYNNLPKKYPEKRIGTEDNDKKMCKFAMKHDTSGKNAAKNWQLACSGLPYPKSKTNQLVRSFFME